MISLAEALEIAGKHTHILGTEKIPYQESLGYVLAQDVYSDVDMPSFNKSAMDGYACRKEDLGQPLEVIEMIPAGQPPTLPVRKGQCSKIMTGAEVPSGADTVIMVEYTKEIDGNKILFTGSKTSTNICLAGEDLQQGTHVLKNGTFLKPQHIAMLAAVGTTQPEVYKKPSLGVISTGSELVEAHDKPGKAKIRNSNGPQIVAQAKALGLETYYYGIAPDKKEETLEFIYKSASENDITIISGGVSVGDFDFVPWAIQKAGFHVHFNKIAVKPGMHTTFATKKDVVLGKTSYIIGLPGNPVSSFIQFEIFTKEIIFKLMGAKQNKIIIPLKMSEGFSREKTTREELIPIILTPENKVECVPYHGSAHIHAYHEAYGVISIAMGKSEIKKGEVVYVRPL